MTSSTQKQFLVLYQIPTHVIDAWAKTDQEKREQEETRIKAEWGRWIGEHMKKIVNTEAAGKTKLVTASGISETRNNIVLYSVVQADNHDEAALMFKNHPHLQIPESSIEIMEIRPMDEM